MFTFSVVSQKCLIRHATGRATDESTYQPYHRRPATERTADEPTDPLQVLQTRTTRAGTNSAETKAKHQLIPPAKVACPHSVRNGKVIQAPGFGYYRFMLGRSVRRFVARRRKDEAGLAEKQRDKIAFKVAGAQ